MAKIMMRRLQKAEVASETVKDEEKP